ncbi:MAG: hypothetical protein CMJ58_01915 [Planctomycetaceae bacterium]|nr:hypothetical protein [Planctomycetaceae bacterium]
MSQNRFSVEMDYSLDLLALLVTPLAFPLFDYEAKNGKLTASPTALLESLRRYADKLTLFWQAGKIHRPTKARQLFGYLEQCVVEVAAPRGGVFHPKLWVLRFEPIGRKPDNEWPIEYRVLCPSRILTLDRSWDTMLAIEGTYWPQEPRSDANSPLAQMISRLPDLAVRQPTTETASQHTRLLAKELPRVAFEPPEDAHSIRFLPLGLDSSGGWPFDRPIDRLLVISPFVSDGMIRRVSQGAEAVVVSRTEELARLQPETLKRLKAAHTLDPAAESDALEVTDHEEPVELSDGADEGSQGNEESPRNAGNGSLSGLHAKVYIADRNGEGHVWTGSANATDAAFEKNVEILVELVGRKEQYGLEAVLDSQNTQGLRSLLQPFVRPQENEVDEVAERLERLLDAAQMAIASHELRIHVGSDNVQSDELFNLRVRAANPLPAQWLSAGDVSCRPITLRETWQQKFVDSSTATFQQLHFDRLTPFILFCVRVSIEERSQERQFVVNLPIEGLPEDRRKREALQAVQRWRVDRPHGRTGYIGLWFRSHRRASDRLRRCAAAAVSPRATRVPDVGSGTSERSTSHA